MPARARSSFYGPKLSSLRPGYLLFWFLVVFGLLIVFGLFGKVYLGYRNRLWDNKTRFTIVVAKENPEVYSFESATKTLVHFSIPKNTQIEASNKMGKWYIGSLWQLGKQKGLKGELLQKSIQKSFGIATDAWV